MADDHPARYRRRYPGRWSVESAKHGGRVSFGLIWGSVLAFGESIMRFRPIDRPKADS